jgi:prevent-host-death family protein
MRKMAAGKFKNQCLAVMDIVHRTGEPVIVTKHGKPVVKLVPVRDSEDDIFDSMAGRAKVVGDIINTVPLEDWECH